jgi:hypothetical protein
MGNAYVLTLLPIAVTGLSAGVMVGCTVFDLAIGI